MALKAEKPGERYGFVTYIEQDRPFYKTGAYEGGNGKNEPDPEGEFMYEFMDGAWIWPIYTKRDQEFFLANPTWYEVKLPGGRPGGRPRPAKSAPEGSAEPPISVPPAPKPEAPKSDSLSLRDKLGAK